MFQSVGHTAIEAIADCANVPIIRRCTSGRSVNHGLHYSSAALAAVTSGSAVDAAEGDEIGALFALLSDVRARFPSVRGVSCGAILSTYQRGRVEVVCRELGFTPLAPLWQREQAGLLTDMIDAGIDAVLVKVASLGLTLRMLGGRIADLHPRLHALVREAGLNECGEGGEYETLVLDAPFFSRRLLLTSVDRVVVSRDDIAPVAHLCIRACETEVKEDAPGASDVTFWNAASALAFAPGLAAAAALDDLPAGQEGLWKLWLQAVAAASHAGPEGLPPELPQWPSPREPSAETVWSPAAAETAAALAALRACLLRLRCTLEDVAFVHVYLSDMADFAQVNAAYCTFFGENPPSRSCVQVPGSSRRDAAATVAPGVDRIGDICVSSSADGSLVFVGGVSVGSAVALDCVAVRGSGAALSAAALLPPGAAPVQTRSVLHVASLSRWAPLCLGPYSQANVSCGLAWCAGQIGLRPDTMRLVVPSPPGRADLVELPSIQHRGMASVLRAVTASQTHQACLNTARVLAAVGSSLPSALALLVYVNESAINCGHGVAGLDQLMLEDIRACTCSWVAGAPAGLAAPQAGDDGDSDPGSDEESAHFSAGETAVSSVGGALPHAGCGEALLQERLFSLGPGARVRPRYAVGLERSPRNNALTSADSLLPSEMPPPSLQARLPVHLVVVPQLPRNALVEVEALCLCLPAGAAGTSGLVQQQGGFEVDDVADVEVHWVCHWAVGDAPVLSLWVGILLRGDEEREAPGSAAEHQPALSARCAAAVSQRCRDIARRCMGLLASATLEEGAEAREHPARVASAKIYAVSGACAGEAADRAESSVLAAVRELAAAGCAVTRVQVLQIPRVAYALAEADGAGLGSAEVPRPARRSFHVAVHLVLR